MKFQERSVRSIPSNTNIAIYGAGEFGRTVKEHLEQRGQGNHVTCFFDSFGEGEFCGLPVVNIHRIGKETFDFDVVVVASDFSKEIVENLYSQKITNYIIINKVEFFNRDLSISEFNGMQHRRMQSRNYLPNRVLIQLSSVCNLKCKMCPHGEWTIDKPFMDKDVFLRVLEECKKNDVSNITLGSSRGESLLHKNFFEFSRIASEKDFNMYFSTNAVLLNSGNIDELLESGFSAIDISFCGSDKKSYESVYVGASFEHAVECLLALKEKTLKMRNPPLVSVRGTVIDNDNNARDRNILFLKELGYSDSEISISLADNFAGGSNLGIYYPLIEINTLLPIDDHALTLCTGLDAWVVYTDGLVGPCGCRNYRKLNILGNIRTGEFADMAKSEINTSLIESFVSGNVRHLDLCRKCDLPYRRA
ncbi:radical SAM protein [Desulfovibrio gilichinskyi]|uniref:Radical SAM superfamily protein n=1 Tax=Desulfovibrio gilichinskyi TaxID=1519643 RepID=A0A1X7EAN6_9BACT|nr:radical SAM protein [Desulfovibrio gilichinskyi]SMF30457.1 Radical SAM superfamily protein [Desulfovibrio gilichinskyi]